MLSTSSTPRPDDGESTLVKALLRQLVPEYVPSHRPETLVSAGAPYPDGLLMRAVTTAGERVCIDCDIPWLSRLLATAAAGELSGRTRPGETVRAAGPGRPSTVRPGRMGADRARCLGGAASRPPRGRLLVRFRPAGGPARIGVARRGALPSRAAHASRQHAAAEHGSGCWPRRPCCITRRCGGPRCAAGCRFTSR